ncbi:MAG: hypothetical protein U0836_22405 [Pirellulales bacterium]
MWFVPAVVWAVLRSFDGRGDDPREADVNPAMLAEVRRIIGEHLGMASSEVPALVGASVVCDADTSPLTRAIEERFWVEFTDEDCAACDGTPVGIVLLIRAKQGQR